MPGEIEGLLEAYLSARWATPVAVSGLKRFHGGSARETYRFDAAAGGTRRGLVLRRDPASSLIETDRSIEFAALQAYFGTAVPVPEPLFVEADAGPLGSPGFIMAELPEVRAASPLEPEPYGAAAGAIGEQLFTILGAIHRDVPPMLSQRLPVPENAAAARLAHWRATIAEDAIGPEPVAWAAIRWLEANLPPPGRISVVHGDYRSGNFLIDATPQIRGIVDWEMVHLGDAHEDLAWVMDPFWAHGSTRPAGTIEEPEAIGYWEAASGLVVEPLRLRWWKVMAQLQGLAIWISSAKEVADGRSIDPALIFAGLVPYRYHNATLARALQALAA